MWSNASKQQVAGAEGDDENDGNAIRNRSDFFSLEQETTSPTNIDLFQPYSTVSMVPAFYTSLLSDRKHPFIQVADRN